MGPQDKPTFYLYGIGYSPKQLSLGTVVYGNYAVPDARFFSFPQLSDQEVADTNVVTSQAVSGCFTNASDRKYGFGIEALDPAKVSLGVTQSKSKVITAKSGRRVTLNQPETFFLERVVTNDSIRKILGIWLTTATSMYILKTATLQKPRIYCVTGIYELTDVVAKTNDASSLNLAASVSDTVMGAATGVPIGATIGPFADGKTMEANLTMAGPAIWAARFHRLSVAFLRMSTKGDTTLPPTTTIKLYPDVTFVHGVRKSEAETNTTEQIAWPKNIEKDGENLLAANAVTVTISEPEELSDDGEDNIEGKVDNYWTKFTTAESRIAKGINVAEAAKKAKVAKTVS
ncbi:hypothetical protein BGZ60DRAFT_423995 [Tricladium varicosporioides]|nr:hypothetical protein BGZ60DRAFT_423995 [Hymenoscyphus varicosporioides]